MQFVVTILVVAVIRRRYVYLLLQMHLLVESIGIRSMEDSINANSTGVIVDCLVDDIKLGKQRGPW